MKNLNTFIKQLILYLPSQILPGIVSLIIILLLTRNISVEDYGKYTIFTTTALLISTICTQWLQQSILYYRPQFQRRGEIKRFDSFISLIIQKVSKITLFLVIVTFFISILFPLPYSITVSLILIVILQGIFSVYQTMIQSDMKVITYGIRISVMSILKLLLFLGIVHFFYKDVTQLLWATVISLLVVTVNDIVKTLRTSTYVDSKLLVPFLKKLLLYGLPMVGWFLSVNIMNTVDRFMIGLIKGSYEVGIYSANFSIISSALALVFAPFLTVIHPIFMKESSSDELNKIKISNLITVFTNIFVLFATPIIILVYLFHEEISNLLLGEKYVEGSEIIPILMMGLFFWNMSMVGHKGLEVEKKTGKLFIFAAISCFMNVLFNLILINKLGYIGSAWASLFSFIIYFLLIYIYSQKNIKWILDYKFLLLVILSSFIAFSIVKLNHFITFNNSLLVMIVNTIIFFVAYVLVMLVGIKLYKFNLRF